MAHAARYVPEGRPLVEVSTRTFQGRYFLKPTPEVNEIINGIVGRAQRMYQMDICLMVWMSNHYHALVKTHPEIAAAWSDEEVAERWLKLSPRASDKARAKRRSAILSSTKELKRLRKRLGNLSWYMKYINEPIARRANKEDDAKGRFWEGRFHSEALLDEAAVIAAMAYVDLNPVRAKMVDDPAQTEHTSLARRLSDLPFSQQRLRNLDELGLTLSGYINLLRWTVAREQSIELTIAARLLNPIRCQPMDWLKRMDAHHTACRARGSESALRRYAEQLGQRWVKGVRMAPPT